jgi:uncharacterized protein (DUF342 family)
LNSNPAGPWQGEDDEMLNQSYGLFYEEDGVYFETSDSFARENKDDVLRMIERKSIRQLNTKQLLHAIDHFPCRICIAPAQEEYLFGEQAEITISDDQMEALISFLPAEPGGSLLTIGQVMEAIAAKGVRFGIDESLLETALAEKTRGEPICFAKGSMPENGKDGELQFHFETECLGTPEVNEKDGRVDYRNLNLFVQVNQGQKLVSRTRATPGSPGYTVTGRELKQKAGKEVKLPGGKNVRYDEERLTMFAEKTGRADYKNRTVTVSTCYTVGGDADLSVGNIRFNGDVLIKGNVISDITIEATGNIEVNGAVEGARLIAGGNIVLKSGIQGNDKGHLEAGGDVIAKYIERTKVQAAGNIVADAFIHCLAESGNAILAKGKFGSIIGGAVKAQNSVTAQNIGAAVSSKTSVEVGLPPAKRARLKFLVAEMERLRGEIDKFDKIIHYLSHMESLPPEKEQMKKTVIIGKLRDTKLIGEYAGELELLEEDVKRAEMGKVHVTDTVYPGVKLTISMGEYTVTTPVKFSTFYCKNREVLFTSCQK